MRREWGPVRILGLGALTVGTLDILDAFVFAGLRGYSPARVLQGIAAGLLGRASFAGGAATAVLGGVLHYSIASAVVTVCFLASRRLPLLTRRIALCGPAYGVLVWIVMNYVVIPLSAITLPPLTIVRLLNGLGIHILGVGTPSALFARAALRSRTGPSPAA